MKIKYISAFLSTLLLFVCMNAYALTQGRFVGKIDGTAIDVEVACNIDDARPNSFGVRSEKGMDSEKDKNNDGIVVQIGAMNMNGMMMSVVIKIKDESYKFGTRKFKKDGKKITYSGSLNNKKRGEFDVDFTITCD
ncbi:MAG: hypothetical protein KAJ95_11745 [Gammaproteobacteria bacterium]|nr:hypothetical protein [Gammaproteobacteria bacterium]